MLRHIGAVRSWCSTTMEPEPEPEPLAWPALPAAVRRLDAAALAHHRRSRAALAANAALGRLLAGTADRERAVSSHATRKSAVLQLPVCDVVAATRLLDAAPASVTNGWTWQALGRSAAEQQRARKLAIVASAATMAAAEQDGGSAEAEGAAEAPVQPVAVHASTARGRRTDEVLRGASLSDPATFKSRTAQSYVANTDVEDIHRRVDGLVTPTELPTIEAVVRELVGAVPAVTDEPSLQKALRRSAKRHGVSPRKSQLLHVYSTLVASAILPEHPGLRHALVKKHSKSESGVLVITVVTSPTPSYTDQATGQVVSQAFSCEWDCHYCPNEPGQPRSYLHDEPSVLRANMNQFDPVLQFTDRAATLSQNGHPLDKVELLVLGGTWSSYPHAYQAEFVRDLFFAANTFYERPKRERRSLVEEQTLNEGSSVKIIGLTLETRPDTITPDELRRLRRYGCTRVQLGLQHTSDDVLRNINRGCNKADAARAIALLKDAAFKVDVHLMPNLPGSSPSADREMFQEMLDDPLMQADQW